MKLGSRHRLLSFRLSQLPALLLPFAQQTLTIVKKINQQASVMITKSSLLRKALLFIALALFTWNATAQNSIHYKLNPQTSKTFDCFGGLKAKIIAEENDQLLITGQTTKSIVINRLPDNIVVRWVDKQLNIQQEYVLPESRLYELIATTLIDNSVVLLVGINTKDQYEVRRIVLNKSNLKQTSEESLYTNSKARKGLTMNWFATSEDGDFNALMLVTEKEDNKFDAQILMLDDNLQLLWQRESTLPGCNGMWVSNDGELYMATASSYKIYFAKLTDDDNFQYYIETDKALDRMELLNVVDDCIIVGGTTHEVIKKVGTKITGYFSASYNMATGRPEGQDFQNMSGMEEIVLKNWSADTKPQGHSSRLSISNHVATPYGGVMLLSLNRLDVTINNGMRHETYTRFG